MTPSRSARTWITAYADAAFRASRDALMASAARHGIDEHRPWDRADLERTAFYAAHKATLDQARGGGYWLWKPFIIRETLRAMAPGDVLIYADAGIEILAPLDPLLSLCRARGGLMAFAGHYDDFGGPGPNLCGKWTKRECFVRMGCDEPRYHRGPMLDASLLLLARSARAEALVDEWLARCGDPRLLTDAPSACGLPELPEFVEHRHDQAILALLAIRDGLELFRHPSQFGNHLKTPPWREPGEWTRRPYGAHGLHHNSPYGTLLRHHRGALADTPSLELRLQRLVHAPPAALFRAWTDPDVWRRWTPLGARVRDVRLDVRVGGAFRIELAGGPTGGVLLDGAYLDVAPPTRLACSWRWDTRVTVAFEEEVEGEATVITLTHGSFSSERLREYHRAAWSALLDIVAASVAPVTSWEAGA